MKINWKVRVKNPWFWVQIAIAALVSMLAYAGLTGADLTTWSKLGKLVIDTFSNPYCLFTVAVAVINSAYDPTTKGLGDSARALTYTEPKEDESNG